LRFLVCLSCLVACCWCFSSYWSVAIFSFLVMFVGAMTNCDFLTLFLALIIVWIHFIFGFFYLFWTLIAAWLFEILSFFER
jgi:hypothetical protein